MYHDFAPKLAKVLTQYSQPLAPNQKALIVGTPAAMPLIEALYEAILRRGGFPMVRLTLSNLTDILLSLGTDEQVAFASPDGVALMETADVVYFIHADTNVKAMSTFSADRLQQWQNSRNPYLQTYRDRWAAGDLRWNICTWPTEAKAQQAEMGLLAYTDFIYRAGALDRDDPVAYWLDFKARQDRLIAWLDGKTHVEVKGPGVELSFDTTGRNWVNAHGDYNFPDGEIYTGPVEDSVNGTVAFNYPTVYLNREVNGVKLRYENGVVVEASADKGEDYFLSKLNMDAGARRMGEFAIGTNTFIQQFMGDTAFDEKIGGTIHMALGSSVPMTLGQNKSVLHWDMVHDMKIGGTIEVDGELLYKDGRFVIAA